jgi:hypothetical protein
MDDPHTNAAPGFSVTKLFWSSLRWMFAAAGLYALVYLILVLTASPLVGKETASARWAFKWLPVLFEPLAAVFYLSILVAFGSALILGWKSIRRH